MAVAFVLAFGVFVSAQVPAPLFEEMFAPGRKRDIEVVAWYPAAAPSSQPAPYIRAGRAGASDIIYQRSASKYYRVDVKDTLHLDFTDMNYWGGPLRQRGAFGKIDPAERPRSRARSCGSSLDRKFSNSLSVSHWQASDDGRNRCGIT